MASSRFERLFEDLDAGFEAAMAREEEEAASDLALSFQQDATLDITLARGGWRLSADGAEAAVAEVGVDYLVAHRQGADLLLRLDRVVLTADESCARPQSTGRKLIDRLRAHARRKDKVVIATGQGSYQGVLLRATPDHLMVRGRGDDFVIPLAAIEEVRVGVG